MKINNKIFIPAIIVAIFVCVTGVLYLDTINDGTVNTTQKQVEPKSYSVGLLPPPEPIFNSIIGISGVDDAIVDTEGRFSFLLEIFDEHDEMMIFIYDPGLPPPDMKTTILLSMNPVTDDTSFQGFIYYEEGIQIDMAPRGELTQEFLLNHQNFNEIQFEVNSKVTGEYVRMGIQEIGDETYDFPAQLKFVDSENFVFIRGFITDDRMLTLATALVQ